MKFSQSLAAKLGATFGGVLLLMLVSVLVSGIGLWKFAETIDTITQKTSFRASAARDLRKSYSMLGQYARNAAILSDLKQIDAEVAAYQIERKRFGQTLQDISDNATRLGSEQEEIATHRAIMGLAQVVLGSLDKAIQLGASGDSTGAVTTLTMEMRGDEQKLISQFEEFVALQDRLTGIAVKRSEELKFLIYAVLVGTFFGSLWIALLASWKMTRSIVGRINIAVQWAKDIAAGDLRSKAYLHSMDEVGHMLMALESMREQLTSLVADIGVTADYIQNAAAEVSVGNIDLNARTEASAASIEKANAWLTGLVEVVNETSQVSTEAQDLSMSATDIARTGETLVVSAIQKMQDISKNAKQISAITSVIDGIAFQTNILALNAAVEAARAGEHGRGFAVVAGEVRLLASRAGDAAKQIRQLIETSAACTRDGSEVVDRAGKSMHEVFNAVEKLGTLVKRIQESGMRQSRELTEVSSSISSIEDATQQNAALVEESAAAASALKDQSLQLTMKTKYFTLEEPMSSIRISG